MSQGLLSENPSPGTHSSPLFIAEIGSNHNGDVGTAHTLIDSLSRAGAQYVKFQLYTVDELISDPSRLVEWGPPAARVTQSVGDMFSSLALPREAFPELFAHVRERGMVPLATPFSCSGVDFLVNLNTAFIKIASSDVSDLELLKCASSTGIPVILSTGKATMGEVEVAVDTVQSTSQVPPSLLHCVAGYPTPLREANLRMIHTLKTLFSNCRIGISDHSRGLTGSLAAVALGAEIVERHVTLSRDLQGPDHWFSLEPNEFTFLTHEAELLVQGLGDGRKRLMPSEMSGRLNSTKSLISAQPLYPGDVISRQHIKVVRPGTGIHPHHLDQVIGMTVRHKVKMNEPLSWEHLKD